MQITSKVSIPIPYNQQQFILVPDELKRLWLLKLINDRCYIYLALQMTYATAFANVDIPKFSEAWDISEADCRSAIAALHKKGCLEPVAQQLELQLYTLTEAIAEKDA